MQSFHFAKRRRLICQAVACLRDNNNILRLVFPRSQYIFYLLIVCVFFFYCRWVSTYNFSSADIFVSIFRIIFTLCGCSSERVNCARHHCKREKLVATGLNWASVRKSVDWQFSNDFVLNLIPIGAWLLALSAARQSAHETFDKRNHHSSWPTWRRVVRCE